MAITLTRVVDLGDDVLQVTGVDGDGNEVTGSGWVSAMTNFYPATAYDDAGERKPSAKPRAMTKAEQKSYWLTLLGEATAENVPETVLYEA